MNKKFLSAILFGALMATSAGTFVSCKDYDDDIENLQGQIDKNSSAIAELQKLVGAGNWVTSISPVTGGFTVTMSNGQSQTITGINGADGKDGKNGTEWTIGEDGFWYMDGEKTDNVAIGKNGENGVTAPSPTIGADGNWVVYNWDAEKGEFVAEATEIPAQGTAAYAVEANGVITLHIADANGEYMEVVLPATSDSFVAATPAAMVNISFEQANWKPVTSKTDKEMFAKMTKAFPELAEYKKGDLMMQGGNLPVIITPANVELNNNFTFALQSVKGEVSEAKVSSPVKGMPEASLDWLGGMTTRSAKAEDAFWTLKVEPAKNKKGDKYVDISSNNRHSLVIENEKGTVVKTPFAYYLSIIDNADVTISTPLTNVDYADAIDVLTPNADGDAVFAIAHGLNGYYLLEATDILEVEQYGITIEGSKLMIANMPANKTSITVDLKLTAVGLNGSVEEATTTLTIGQAIAATGTLADKTVTLGYNANATVGQEYMKAVRWNIADLGFTATQLNQFLGTKAAPTTKTLTVTYEDEDGNVVTEATESIVAYDKNGVASTTNGSVDYSNAVTFGFNLNSQTYEPKEYAIRLEVEAGGAVIYAAEAALTVENPTLGEGDVKLVPGFVDANGVYQITGEPKPAFGAIAYKLNDALILNNKVAKIDEIIDADYAQYVEDERDDEAYEKYHWIGYPDADTYQLKIHTWKYYGVDMTTGWTATQYNQLYQKRNIRAMLELFGNPNNVVPFDFQIEVKSELYTETPADAITFDATKLVGVFGAKNADGTLASIDIKAAITKALVQAGTDKGKTYQLFATSKATSTGGSSAVINLASPKKAGSYVLGTDGNIVELSLVEYLQMIDAFGTGLQDVNHANIITGDAKYKLTTDAWNAIWTVAANYYTTAGTGIYYDANSDGEIDEDDWFDSNADGEADAPIFAYSGSHNYINDHKEEMAIYAAFKSKISFNNTSDAVAGTPGTAVDKNRDPRVASVTIKFNEPAVAAIYFSGVTDGVVFTAAGATAQSYADAKITPVTEAPNSVTGGQVKVGLTLTIRDAWGMIMNVPFEVTVKTSAN